MLTLEGELSQSVAVTTTKKTTNTCSSPLKTACFSVNVFLSVTSLIMDNQLGCLYMTPKFQAVFLLRRQNRYTMSAIDDRIKAWNIDSSVLVSSFRSISQPFSPKPFFLDLSSICLRHKLQCLQHEPLIYKLKLLQIFPRRGQARSPEHWIRWQYTGAFVH